LFKIDSEDWNEAEEKWEIVIQGRGRKDYKRIKRLLDLLQTKWFSDN